MTKNEDEPFNAETVEHLLRLTWPKRRPEGFSDPCGLAADLNLEIRGFVAYRLLDTRARKEAIRKLSVLGTSARRIVDAFKNKEEADVLRPILERAAKAQARQRKEGFNELALPLSKKKALLSSDDERCPDKELTYFCYNEKAAIQRVIDAAKLLKEWVERTDANEKPKRLGLGPEVRLIGLTLPKIYQRYFGEKLVISPAIASELVPEGPGVRFVEGVLRTADIRQANGAAYSRHTIAKYLHDYEAGGRRRHREAGGR